MERIGFIDVEASSLGAGGYPIEVGWALVPVEDGCPAGATESGAVLVRPHEDWLAAPGSWDPAAEAVHGISLERLLAEGADPDSVAALLDGVLGGGVLHSDAPGTDAAWLGELFAKSGVVPRFRLVDFSLACEFLTDRGYEFAHREARSVAPRTHRAEADALHLAAVFRLGLEHPEGGATRVPPEPAIGWKRTRGV